MNLTMADVAALRDEPSATTRAQLAQKVAQGFNADAFNIKESVVALEIFRLLLRDVEVKVRRALSENLKHNMRLPKDIAMRLARDVADVAVPMLEYSHALSEEDLSDIVKSTKVVAKLMAVARRGSISHSLARSLINTKNEQVVLALLSNGGSSIAEQDLQDMVREYQFREGVLEALVHRGRLPLYVVDRLFDVVSDSLKTVLTGKYRMNRRLAEDSLQDASRWAKQHMDIPENATDQSIEMFVESLHNSGQLDYTILIRALCNGDMRFFEAAIARLADIPLMNARILMLDPGPLGFKALYNISPLPPALYDAIKSLFESALEVTAYGKFRREDFRERMLEKIMAQRLDQKIEYMPYLMSIIGKDPVYAHTIN